MPWKLSLGDGAAIGEGVEIYNMGQVSIGARVLVGPHAYFCAGAHDLTVPELPLLIAPIVVEDDAFIGTRATLLQGVRVQNGAVVALGAVVVKDAPAWTVVGGNPAKPIKARDLQNRDGWKKAGANLENYPVSP